MAFSQTMFYSLIIYFSFPIIFSIVMLNFMVFSQYSKFSNFSLSDKTLVLSMLGIPISVGFFGIYETSRLQNDNKSNDKESSPIQEEQPITNKEFIEPPPKPIIPDITSDI